MSINFVNILDADIEQQMNIRNWRNNENIRKYMLNDHIISEEKHLDWLESLKNVYIYIFIFLSI